MAAMLDAIPEMMATLPPRTALNPWQLVELGVRECVLVGVEASHHLGPFHHMNSENTNGESTPPAITSLSPTRSGASSVAEIMADGLAVDDRSKCAAEVAHIIISFALLDNEMVAR